MWKYDEIRSKISSTKSDLRIFKISHSSEAYISEIRERIGLGKIQCSKLQMVLKTNIRYMRIIYIRSICTYESCLYFCQRFDKYDRRNESDFLCGIIGIIHFMAWWSVIRLKIIRVIKRVIENFESTSLTRSIYFCGHIKVIPVPRFDDHLVFVISWYIKNFMPLYDH